MTRILALLFCIPLLVKGQSENPNYAGKVSEFQQAYNNGNYGLIFNMFDTKMQQVLPMNKTRDFFTNNVKSKMGNIVQMQFLELRDGAHIYRTRFDKAVSDIMFSLDAANAVNGFYIYPPRPSDAPIIERNRTLVRLPFDDEWFVFWGGTTLEENYHVAIDNQKYAYDLLVMKEGKTFDGDPKKNQSYYAYGKLIKAPCNARVVSVIEGVADNTPGEQNTNDVTGNTVILQTDNDEFLLFAHLKEDSIRVQQGQDIYSGDVIGECGNSGNSTEPHLHLSLQNTADFPITTGGKLFFDSILVDGVVQRDYLPRKGEYISNSN